MVEKAFIIKQRTIKENVESLLNKFPYLLSDYTKLVWYYWFYIDNIPDLIKQNKIIAPEDFKQLTKPESITRAFRQLVNEECKFLLPSHVRVGRQYQEERFRKAYGSRQI